MSMLATLTLIKDGEVIRTLNFEGELLLGRSEDCGLRIDDQSISRQHALFRQIGNIFQIEKKSEFAPLYINGIETNQSPLKDSDLISVGPYLIRINLGANEEKKGTPPTKSHLENLPEAPAEKPTPETQIQTQTESQSPSPSPSPSLLEASPIPGIDEHPAVESSNHSHLEASSLEGNLDLNGLTLDPSLSSAEGNAADPNIGLEPISTSSSSEMGTPEIVNEDGKTTITSVAKLNVQLIFKPGDANVEVYEFNKDEVTLGRGKNCDIILKDKKSSRQNSLIRRGGLSFTIKDLGSVNGTYVNGKKIQEEELSGDDLIQVGDTEFKFKVLNAEYAANEKNYLSLPVEESEENLNPLDLNSPEIESAVAQDPPYDPALAGAIPSVPQNPGLPTGTSITGITGITEGSNRKTTLLEKFRALPPRTQWIAVIAIILLLMWLNEDDPPAAKNKKLDAAHKGKTPTAALKTDQKSGVKENSSGTNTFDSLTPEQKRFVEAQHTLAFDYYKNREYDKALFEIQKIFSLVTDYKDAKEIERYAKEGKRKMDAIEEENRRKEDEARLKAQIAELVEKARVKMAKKNYTEARDLFSQIMALDPDNTLVVTWNKEIDSYEEEVKARLQQKHVQEEINRQGRAFFKQAMQEKKKQRFYSAIALFQKVIDIGTSDQKLITSSRKMIKNCKSLIAARRDPLLVKAKEAELAGDLVIAYKLYEKATRVDPRHPAGYAGMNRIKKVLHDRAKAVYTEAILAESYSDFEVARKRFEECLKIAPSDDIYHERAQRKLSHYFIKEEAPQK